MKLNIVFILLISISLSLYSSDNKQINRFAILVGANDGGDERAILRYAETDAKSVAKVFSDIGGIDANNSILLLNPTKSSLMTSFEKISQHIKSVTPGTRTELLFYYSGHSDEDGLLIRDRHLYYKDLKKALNSTNADVKIGILDSCSSGALTRLKGGRHNAPFLVDESVKTEGHAFITSAAEDEAAQESNRIQGSFFTHYLVSALKGAADTSLDGKVSLHEAYSYASNETLARTETTQAGPQHASYDFRLSGSGDIVLTDLRDAESNLIITEEDFGRFFIRDSEDNLISEVNKKYGAILKISVPSSSYTIIKEVNGSYYRQLTKIKTGETKQLHPQMYTSFIPESNVVRGNRTNQIEYDLNVPESTAIFAWSENDKIRDLKFDIAFLSKAGSLHGFQLSLANLVVNDAFGAQISPLLNINGGDLSGLQLSGLFNITGGNVENYGIQISNLFNWVSRGSDSFLLQNSGLFNYVGSDTEGVTIQLSSLFNTIGGNAHSFTIQNTGIFNYSGNINGIQLSGIFNASNDFNGIQVTGIFNTSDDFNGIQLSGILNFSDDMKGIQTSGILNSASNVYGAQISLINIADYVYGTQIGLININKDIKGVPIGLINISTEGIKNISYRFDTYKTHHIDYQFGSSYFYNIVSVGTRKSINDIEDFTFGIGCGFHIPISIAYAQIDFIHNWGLEAGNDGLTVMNTFPSMSLRFGIPVYKDLAPFVGVSLSLPDLYTNEDGKDIYHSSYALEDTKHSFFAGVRF